MEHKHGDYVDMVVRSVDMQRIAFVEDEAFASVWAFNAPQYGDPKVDISIILRDKKGEGTDLRLTPEQARSLAEQLLAVCEIF